MPRFAIKLGTSTLTDGSTQLSAARMVDIARQIRDLRELGHEVILVSSGAMAAGRAALGFPQLPKSIPARQMLAAVGQPRLMDVWARLFEIYHIFVAQVLLTRSDLSSRRRYLNARNTLEALLQQGVLPIINENDTVATEEIRVGDNDNLSALVANLIQADFLILLTDQEGLFTDDPRKNQAASLIRSVETAEIPAEIRAAAGDSGRLGTGGMRTKLEAADLARRAGAIVVIASGHAENVLVRLAAGEPLGTRFLPTGNRLESFKRFILSGGQAGALHVDAGAVEAILSGGSLLPPGLVKVDGSFERGAVVRINGPTGLEVGRGLASYAAADCARIVGLQSRQVADVLGYFYGDEVVHRDHLVLLTQ